MKRAVTGTIIAMLLLTTLGSGAAVAHTTASNTSLTINKIPGGATRPGARVIIYGRLRSFRATCRANKVVKLIRVRPGPNLVLARDRTDNEGEYRFVRRPSRDQTVYTKFAGTLRTSYGHSHRCRRDRSTNVFVNIRGR